MQDIENSPEVDAEILEGAEASESEVSSEEAPEMEASGTEEEAAIIEDKIFVDNDQLLSVIESLLFASDRPVGLGTLKQVFSHSNVDTRMIKRALDELTTMYADSVRGVSLEEVTGGWQLRTKLDNMDFLKKISKARPFRLSGPALEVLSIIAYKQPIVKNEIDQIRGVESGHLVRALMEKDLVNFEGKTDLPGKPMAYATTRKFLEIFGLRNLNELPTLSEIDNLLPEGIGDEEEKETLSQVTDMMSQNVTALSYSEGEEELLNISEKIQSIDTSSEFFEQEKIRQKQKKERERAEDIREALAMGETVEKKDVRWLEKYEAQIAEAAAAALAPVVMASEESSLPENEPVAPEEPAEVTDETELYFAPTIKESFVEGDEVGADVNEGFAEEVDPDEDSESFTEGEA